MKVAVVTTRHGAQDDRIYFKQALSLAKRMGVAVIAPDDGEELQWPPSIQYVPIPRRRSPLGRLLSLVEATLAARRQAADICHFHDLDLVLAVPLLKLFTGARLIFDSHEAYPEQFLMRPGIPRLMRTAVARLVNAMEKGLAKGCDHIIAADDPTRRSFEPTGVPATTVFNYPPLEVFEADAHQLQEERARYADRLPIIYQGTVSPARGLFHMIDALPMLQAAEPGILLRIVGLRDRTLRKIARQRAEDAGVAGNLEIVDWLPHLEIAYSMKSSLIGLVPWQPEEKHKRNIPIKVFEYMACGLPMVAADLPSIARYINDSGAGVLYDSTQPDELARCVLELLHDPERRRRMGEAGLRAVRERWNWGEMEKVLFDVYRSLGMGLGEDRA